MEGRAMSAQAHPKLALRPYLAEDAAVLREIFRDSIADLTDEDYTPAQQEAWASAADDEKAFGKRLASQLTLVARSEARPPVLPRSPAATRSTCSMSIRPRPGRASAPC